MKHMKDITEDEIRAKTEEIATLVQEARDAIYKAEQISHEYQINFSFDVAYGMGGTFDRDWDSSTTDSTGRTPFEWISSSQQC